MASGGRRKSLISFFSRSPSRVKDPATDDKEEGKPQLGGCPEGAEVFEIFENERYRDQIGWSSKNLELDDPKNFTWDSGGSDQFETPPVPDGYDYLGVW